MSQVDLLVSSFAGGISVGVLLFAAVWAIDWWYR